MIIKALILIKKSDKANLLNWKRRSLFGDLVKFLEDLQICTQEQPWLLQLGSPPCSSWLLINPLPTSNLRLLYLQLRNSALLWVTVPTPSSELRNDSEFILILSYSQWGKMTLEIGIYIAEWENSARKFKSYVQVYQCVPIYHHTGCVVCKWHLWTSFWNAFQMCSKFH